MNTELFTHTVTRYSHQNDDDYDNAIQRAIERRNLRAEAHQRLIETVLEHDLPWPSLDIHCWDRDDNATIAARYHVDDLDTFRLFARTIRRAIGGLQTKANKDGSLTATVLDGPLAWDIILAGKASPCEQVQVGTKTEVVREEITPPRYREVEKEVPEYEWQCPPSILDPDLLADATEAADGEDDASLTDLEAESIEHFVDKEGQQA